MLAANLVKSQCKKLAIYDLTFLSEKVTQFLASWHQNSIPVIKVFKNVLNPPPIDFPKFYWIWNGNGSLTHVLMRPKVTRIKSLHTLQT